MTTTVDVSAIPRVKHAEAMRLADAEAHKVAATLRSLEPDDWTKSTDCPRWDVRALTAHMVGSAASQASPREFLRQVRAGRPVVAEIGAKYWWDGMNEIQVRERSDLHPTAHRRMGPHCATRVEGPPQAAPPRREAAPAQTPCACRATTPWLPL
jgi:uncharacterized protein (TIGR03083 family)